MNYTLINPATEAAMETIEHLSVEQTDEAIARIDTVLGDGSAPAQQKPQAAPAEPSPKP